MERKRCNLSEAQGLHTGDGKPCRFVQKYKEQRWERFLSYEEFQRLGRVLADIEVKGEEAASAVAAVRLLMPAGCRLGEIQTLR